MKMKKIFAAMAATAISVSAFAAMNITSASAADQIGQAYLAGSFGTAQGWDPGTNNPATVIDGDAQYQVVWDLAEATNTGDNWFLTVVISPTSVENFTTDTIENLNVTLDELYVDGSLITGYDASNAIDKAYYEPGKAGVTRIYINSSWADASKAKLFEDRDIESQIKVVFTVSGTGQDGTSNVTPTEPITQEPTEEPTTEEQTTEEPTTEEQTTEEVTTAAETTAATTTATTAAGATTTTTTKAASSGSSNSSSSGSSGTDSGVAPTGDTGVGVALGVIALAGSAAIVSKKRK